jgi:hypothetical protein
MVKSMPSLTGLRFKLLEKLRSGIFHASSSYWSVRRGRPKHRPLRAASARNTSRCCDVATWATLFIVRIANKILVREKFTLSYVCVSAHPLTLCECRAGLPSTWINGDQRLNLSLDKVYGGRQTTFGRAMM